MEAAIRVYFDLGLNYMEILHCLSNLNGAVLSMSTLKRILKRLRLFRRRNCTDILSVAALVMDEVMKSGKMHGYKLMHLKCLQHGFVVTQETVRQLLIIVDPEGVKMRRKRRLRRRSYSNLGPNYIWHIDGYDKLKQYGICIHGAIDGFSRFIIWMEAHTTNNDPRVVAGYFINSVKMYRGCPTRIRSDRGTENVNIRDIQTMFRSNGVDEYANRCFLVGSSNHNQRIEQWWGFLRKENAQYWMDFFALLKDMGCFDGGFLDKAILQLCFMDLIQAELDEMVQLWNNHRIRPSKNQNVPSGRPTIMYTCAQIYGVQDCLHDVTNNQIIACENAWISKGPYTCDPTVFELCTLIMEDHSRQKGKCAEEAALLYQFLRIEIHNELGEE